MALALIAAASSLKSSWNISIMLLSRTRRRLILLPLATSVTPQNPGCQLTTRQLAENLYVLYRETHT